MTRNLVCSLCPRSSEVRLVQWGERSRSCDETSFGREFAWAVAGNFARWGFTFDPDGAARRGAATKLTESWEFLPSGIAMFEEKYGDQAAAEIDERTRQAHDGIPRTLEAIKRIADSS